MSTPPTDQQGFAAPPPGCPAHRLYGPEAEADPTGLYEKLRAEHGAVAPVLVQGDLPAWLVLGHRENLDVARTPSRFSRDPRRWRDMQEGNVPPDHPLTPVAAWQPVCNFQDGPEHERLRGAVTESLERFDRRGVRRYVTRFANQLIDAFAETGRADLVRDFAEPLPMLVMTQLVGMPDSYGPRLVEAARDMIKGTETAVSSNAYVTEALQQLVERKRAAPGRDFTSWLLEHSTSLTEAEIIEHLRLVLIAAFETTANLIANTLRLVLTDRRFRANLSGGHMTLPDALEQVLWDEPPLTTILGRWATGDTELGGQRIKAGDMLLLGLAAGNADPEIRPDLTLPVHGNRSHLAFSGGPHECPGQDIGRAIADTGIDALLSRLPDLELAVHEGELHWDASLMSRHLVALPVTFTPRGNAVTASSRAPGAARTQPPSGAGAPPAPALLHEVRTVRRSWWARLLGR
ncbi:MULTISPECIES: cytochrome P450 [unclassified Streptomyces]|uniref:cytochrome P450 n=1 Tax=unclassified Streptomyces TaxID=2593676 RepID=UPI001BEBB48B|nr:MULTISPECIES: cytochrome P450 [unclassified Streptomyces]MBT2403195.1 cytochrome P450 [Streptomyces sp. ISL-21]MBT2610128.1 cytochrome P450 [Streptomyces sp. ISL-87]